MLKDDKVILHRGTVLFTRLKSKHRDLGVCWGDTYQDRFLCVTKTHKMFTTNLENVQIKIFGLQF